jgi:hypothetical protein
MSHQRASNKAEREQRASKNCACEIEIVPGGVWLSPSHRWKNVMVLGDVRQHDYAQAYRAQQLQKSPDRHAGHLLPKLLNWKYRIRGKA